MASKFLALLLVFAIFAVALSWPMEEEEDTALTFEDFEAYFVAKRSGTENMQKRRNQKVGKCNKPDGTQCEICNYKIKSAQDMRRYIVCGGKHV